MNIKHITGLLAFVLTFALSATVAGFFKIQTDSAIYLSDGDKINALLVQDIENGRERDIDSSDSIADDTLEYVESSEVINDTDLPADFQNAWHAHLKTWHREAIILAKAENEEISQKNFDFIDSRNRAEIIRTWFEVLRIAQRHGAVIPPDAY